MLELDRVENPFRDQLFRRAIEIKDGDAIVPTTPGLGVEVDEERLAYHVARS
jgi:D-galactarolactone cycloisomerase